MSDDGFFQAPTFRGSLDVEKRIASCPKGGLVKGMFFAKIAEETWKSSGRRVGHERYVPFRGYSLHEWIEFLPEAASVAYPKLDPKEGMRRFGQGAFLVFSESVAGRVLFSMAGRNPNRSIGFVARAFDIIGSHGSVCASLNEPGRAILEIRNMWDYIDSWHIGIYEGALRAFGATGTIMLRQHDLANGDVELRYK